MINTELLSVGGGCRFWGGFRVCVVFRRRRLETFRNSDKREPSHPASGGRREPHASCGGAKATHDNII